MTEKNELCPANAVDTLEKCTEAVGKIKNEIPNAKFGGSDNWSIYPNGCFYDESGHVFFNEHPTGSSHQDARHICDLPGSK